MVTLTRIHRKLRWYNNKPMKMLINKTGMSGPFLKENVEERIIFQGKYGSLDIS